MMCICIYRPPNSGDSNSFQDCLDIIQDQINIYGKSCQQFTICGDFNFPQIKWPEGYMKNRETTNDKEGKQAAHLLDFMEINSF